MDQFTLAQHHEEEIRLFTAPSRRLEAETLRALSRLNPALSALHILLEWTLTIGAAAICWRYFNPLFYLVTVAIIGARQHSLIMLMHDAAHYRLSNNRRLNDWLGELLTAWPFLIFNMRSYRNHHFPHHRYLNTDQDPDWVAKQNEEWRFPMSPSKLALMLACDLVGIGFFKFLYKARSLPKLKSTGPDARAMQIARPLFVFGLLGMFAIKGLIVPLILFWIVPFVTWFQFCFHIRSIAEHFGIPNREGFYAGTRSTERGIFDRLFFLSNDGSFHAEHHLYPSVPVYRLRALHRVLAERGDHSASLQLTQGYIGVLRECAGKG